MSLLLALRAGTRDAHDRLEDGLDVLQRCTSRASYAALLAGLRSVHAPLEHALDRCPATARVLPDWPQRRKTGWLDADLDALGARPVPDAAVPDVTTVEDVIGAAYVVEGATLGGAVVLRSLDPAWPARFFASYGAARGAMWRGFRRQVCSLRGVDEQAAAAAASRTFAAFESACLDAVP